MPSTISSMVSNNRHINAFGNRHQKIVSHFGTKFDGHRLIILKHYYYKHVCVCVCILFFGFSRVTLRLKTNILEVQIFSVIYKIIGSVPRNLMRTHFLFNPIHGPHYISYNISFFLTLLLLFHYHKYRNVRNGWSQACNQ